MQHATLTRASARAPKVPAPRRATAPAPGARRRAHPHAPRAPAVQPRPAPCRLPASRPPQTHTADHAGLPASPVHVACHPLRLAPGWCQFEQPRSPAAHAAPLLAVAPSPLLPLKAILAGAGIAWARAKLQQLSDSVQELFSFSPHRLTLQYLHGAGTTGPLDARRYTLTHCDRTGMLQLSIGHDWHKPQLTGWYKRLLRDEVLAEWRGAAAARIVNGAAGLAHAPKGRPALPSLHIYCHVNAAIEVAGALAKIPWPPAPASLRAHVFQKDMPIVLAALAYAERHLLEASPLLAAAPVYLHLRHWRPLEGRVVLWGTFGDPASWRPHTPQLEAQPLRILD